MNFILKKQGRTVGFTLLELLIVIALIGLLAAITLVSFPGVAKKAREAQGLQFSDSLRASLQMDMVGWWTFDDGSGGMAKDSWSSQNHGTLYGNPQWIKGIVNGALSFNGVDDYVNCGNPTLQITGAITIEFWAYPTNYAKGRQNPICKAYGGEFCMTMEPGSSINLYFGTAGGNSSPYISSNWPVGTLKNDEWIHLAWTKDPANDRVVAYHNGKIVQTKTCGSYCNTVASSLNILIGTGYAGKYVGLIDEVRIYNAALFQAVIQQHYAQGLKKHQDFVMK